MAESASVPLQLQSVALLRGGFKRFVRARDGEGEKEADGVNEVTTISGDAVKQIYEEIIAAPSSSKEKRIAGEKDTVKTEEVIALSDTDDDDLEMVDTSANKELLVAVQQGDLSAAKRVRFCDYNCTDSYGWTPLEIAAVLGHAPLVRWLLSRGGYIKDNNRVLEAVNKKGLANIVKILQDYSRKHEVIDIDSEEEGGVVVKCDECGGEYLEHKKSAHIGSIPHQLANPTHLERQNPGFGIAEGNLGFRLLQRGGWDGRSGLGGGKGRLFPVKTRLRVNREGLKEGEDKGGRITHTHEQIEQVYKRGRRRTGASRKKEGKNERKNIVVEVGEEDGEKMKRLRMELSDLQ